MKASIPSRATVRSRERTLEKVCRAVSRFGGQYKVAVFGSAAIGVDGDKSDMDLCVVVRLAFHFFSPGKKIILPLLSPLANSFFFLSLFGPERMRITRKDIETLI